MVSDERDHLALYLDVLCIQQRQFCLPKMAHLEHTIAVTVQSSNRNIIPIESLRIG